MTLLVLPICLFREDCVMARTQPEPPRLATWVAGSRALTHAALLAASLREFGGALAAETLWVYLDPGLGDPAALACPPGCRLVLAPAAPAEAAGLPFAGKPGAAAAAERVALAAGRTGLAWLDDDTVILAEPAAFTLPAGVDLGWRPVMHRNIAPLAGAAPGPFWSRLWQLLDVPAAAHFPCVTVADGDRVRTYVNAGCLVVRPEAGLLQAWAEDFRCAAADDELRALCRQEARQALFLHQAALGATIARRTRASQRFLLPESYNWPLLFDELFGARRDFHDLTGVVSLRHEGLLPAAGGERLERLCGPPAILDWLRLPPTPRE